MDIIFAERQTSSQEFVSFESVGYGKPFRLSRHGPTVYIKKRGEPNAIILNDGTPVKSFLPTDLVLPFNGILVENYRHIQGTH